MNILFDNVDVASNSGPNGFAKKLSDQLQKKHNVSFYPDQFTQTDVQLSFIEKRYKTAAPTVQRLDGIYFNTRFDFDAQNMMIKKTYNEAEAVIVQSEFDRMLISERFGARTDINVIHNGAPDWKNIRSRRNNTLEPVGDVWLCASAWRPHKRLNECIRYFCEHSLPEDILLVAGSGTTQEYVHKQADRVFYIGDLAYHDLINWMLAVKYFIHLAWLDHCPNVVVDARQCGCHIICSSSGGTEEIAGLNSTVVIEPSWNFEPVDLYDPPSLDFTSTRQGRFNNDCSIDTAAASYERVLASVMK